MLSEARLEQVKILGIDPGSRLTGYAFIEVNAAGRVLHVQHGVLRVERAGDESADRLLAIFEGLSRLIELHRPVALSIERVFFAKNASSALKLGQARGAALVAARLHRLSIFEYSPTEVKSALTGYGQADKEQVQKTIELILKQDLAQAQPGILTQALAFETFDASDAVALAICHGRQAKGLQGSPTPATPWARAIKEVERSKSRRRTQTLAEALTMGKATQGRKK